MAEKIIQLAVDLDEVVFDYVGGFREYALTQGLSLPEDEPSHFSMTESGWFTEMDDFKLMHGKAVDSGIYQNLKMIKDASETLKDLHKSGYGINVLTSRFVNDGQHTKVLTQTANALDLIGVPYQNITFSSEKWRHIYDAYIEDAPHNLLPLQENGRYTITFDRKWNRLVPGDRIANWKECRELLREKFGQ